MQLNIDMKKLDEIVAKAQPKFQQRIEAKPKTQTARTVGPMLQAKSFIDVPKMEAGLLTFCGAWKVVNPLFNMGLKYASWFMPPATVALAKSFLEAMNTVIIPALCAPKEPTT